MINFQKKPERAQRKKALVEGACPDFSDSQVNIFWSLPYFLEQVLRQIGYASKELNEGIQ